MDAEQFEERLRQEGYGEIATRSLPPGHRNAPHAHPFEVRALVLSGQITLDVAGEPRRYGAGQVFTMAAGCEHAETVGGDGVTYVVGRRRPIGA